MPNKWVEFVKSWSKRNNKTYGCAISDPKCKADYRKQKDSRIDLEEALPTEEQVKKPVKVAIAPRKQKEKVRKVTLDGDKYELRDNGLYWITTEPSKKIKDKKVYFLIDKENKVGAGVEIVNKSGSKTTIYSNDTEDEWSEEFDYADIYYLSQLGFIDDFDYEFDDDATEETYERAYARKYGKKK
jgi:hypothetical protein